MIPRPAARVPLAPVSTLLTVEFDRETDGRWIADVPELPGVLAYGRSRKAALAAVQSLAFAVLAADVKQGRRDPKTLMRVQFSDPAAA